MEMTIERRPISRNRPPIRHHDRSKHFGGRCKCFCHTEKAQQLLAGGLALMTGFVFLMGRLSRTK